MVRTFLIAASLGLAAAQQNGVLVPPNNWLYTTGDASCRPSGEFHGAAFVAAARAP